MIASRNYGRGCPYCDGKKVSRENCLRIVNPKLANEWHFLKNESLKPQNVMPNSNKKVWWKCENGHEWLAEIYRRNKGSKCSYCYKLNRG